MTIKEMREAFKDITDALDELGLLELADKLVALEAQLFFEGLNE